MCEMKEILTNFKADWKPFSFFLLIRTNSVGDQIVIEIKSTEWFHFLWHFCCLSFWSNLMKLAIGTGHVADVLTLWWTERDDDIAWPYRKRYWFLNEGRLYFHERWPTTPTTKQKKNKKTKKRYKNEKPTCTTTIKLRHVATLNVHPRRSVMYLSPLHPRLFNIAKRIGCSIQLIHKFRL